MVTDVTLIIQDCTSNFWELINAWNICSGIQGNAFDHSHFQEPQFNDVHRFWACGCSSVHYNLAPKKSQVAFFNISIWVPYSVPVENEFGHVEAPGLFKYYFIPAVVLDKYYCLDGTVLIFRWKPLRGLINQKNWNEFTRLFLAQRAENMWVDRMNIGEDQND